MQDAGDSPLEEDPFEFGELWDPDEYSDPYRERVRRMRRIVALIVVVALILSLILPVIVRVIRRPAESEPPVITVLARETVA